MANQSSPHILNASATLLGFCLFVITSLHSSSYSQTSIIDEFTSAISVVLVASSLFSFFSIQTSNPYREKSLEKIAEYLFAFALIGILVIVLLLALNIIK